MMSVEEEGLLSVNEEDSCLQDCLYFTCRVLSFLGH